MSLPKTKHAGAPSRICRFYSLRRKRREFAQKVHRAQAVRKAADEA